ncbi:MAG: fumarylacetoacetate hydrolase family protein, partial [Burkholderiales bacterium]
NARSDARIFALGVAYKDHQLETGRSDSELPSMFIKMPNSLVGHGQPLVRPKASAVYDFEGEIVIVIGKGGRAIPEGKALEHVAGYSILMDGSLRDFQKASVTAGKNFDRSSSYGPWMLTADQVPDWRKLEVTTRLNGNQVQHSAFGMLIWPIEFVIHYISTFTRLEPGDSISTGTPAGVGFRRTPPLLMKAGDDLEVSVSGVGTLKHKIIDEA